MIIQSPRNSSAGLHAFYGGAPSMPPLVGRQNQITNSIDYGVDDKRDLLKNLLKAIAIEKPELGPDGRLSDKSLKKLLDSDPSLKKSLKEILESTAQSLRKFIEMLNAVTRPDDGQIPSPGPRPSPGPSPGPGPGPRPSPGPGPSPGPRPGPGPRPDRGEVVSNKPRSRGQNTEDYHPDRTEKGHVKTANEITTGFVQGAEGNCATISAIKAAMKVMGPDPKDVYKSVTEANGGYDIVQKDGKQIHLGKDELAQAKKAANFNGDDKELMKNAIFMYAVSAKRAQMENNDGVANRSFGHALRSLNDGEYSSEGLKRLGLTDFIRTVPVSALRAGETGTIDVPRERHAMAVMDGRLERWGRRGEAPTEGHAIVVSKERLR